MNFLLHYLRNTIGLHSAKTNWITFSDGTSGQNKNNTLILFFMNLCEQEVFEQITYNFPVRGHFFLPCGCDYGSIKRLMRKCYRVCTPESVQWTHTQSK